MEIASQPPPFDALLTGAARVVMVGVLGWAVLIVLAVVAEAATAGRVRLALRWGCPPTLHRHLIAVATVVVTALATPAPAAHAEQTPEPSGTVLDGLRLPDLPAPLEASSADSRAETAPSVSGWVTVHAGDSLWRISRRLLPARASPARVSSTTNDLYAHNHSLIGPDPDLIHPGQHLRTDHLEDETYSEDS